MNLQAKLISLGVVVLGVILTVAYIHSLRSDIATETAKYNQMVSAAQLYASEINQQNKAVQQLKAASDKQQKAVNAAKYKSVELTKYYETILDNFRKSYVPHNCDGALQWQKDQIKILLGAKK